MKLDAEADGQLAERAAGGDREAFTELLRRHDRLMRAVAGRIVGHRGLLDDALQDAYVSAYRSLGRFRSDGPFVAWLRRIVVNTCIDHVRRQDRRSERSLGPEDEGYSTVRGPEAVPDAMRLHEALRRLPPDQRVSLVLVEWEGYSYDEVAALTGISAGTVGSRLSRARATLRAVLETP